MTKIPETKTTVKQITNVVLLMGAKLKLEMIHNKTSCKKVMIKLQT